MYSEYYLDDLEIEQPIGANEIVFNITRDPVWHGIFFEASTSDLRFYGQAADYLRIKKETEGMRADVTFRIKQACGVYDELETIFEGKLDFRKYSRTCGTVCVVSMPTEPTGCLMTFRNRYDQKVDMDSSVAFNKTTAIQQYAGLNFEMEIAPKELEAAVEGAVNDEGDVVAFDVTSILFNTTTLIRPSYGREINNSIKTGQLIPFSAWETNGSAPEDSPISPQMLYDDDIDCFEGDFEYDIRMKGQIAISGGDGTLDELNLVLFTWDGVGDVLTDRTVIATISLATGVNMPLTQLFDESLSGTIPLVAGLGLYAVIEAKTVTDAGANRNYSVTFDKETSFLLSAPKLCPATNAKVYLVNESLSHAAEAITDGCMKVKSDYYGRTDSEPYASVVDGCGSNRILTSGLKIRRADGAKFFASFKDLFEGLRPIDNIGLGIEDNPDLPGKQLLRVEDVGFFYQDDVVLSLPFVPNATENTQEQLYYSLIKTGYKKWEVESVNGLNEFNSNREYRTSLGSVNNPLDIQSAFIAGGYAWEITRQQNFADTGQADTKFDNDTFIACVERQAYGWKIEQGNIDDPVNIFSPSTAYNWRIRPFANLMRWYKSIAYAYPNLVDTTNKIFFSSGTGNFTASGQLGGVYPTCKPENGPKAENRDLYILDFADQTEAKPMWKGDYFPFRYPLSVKEYKILKANPYGCIEFQCGNGEYKKGFIQEAKYNLMKGTCDFVLKLKYE